MDLIDKLPDARKLGDDQAEYRSYKLFFSEPQEGMLLVVVRTPPRARLLLAPETDYSRKADSIGVSQEVKIGVQEVDDAYVIRCEDRDTARELLSDRVLERLKALEPIVELELTDHEYRLLKRSSQARDIDALLDIVGMTRRD